MVKPRYGERTLTLEDIEAMSLGAWILGTGGGGSPYVNLLNTRQLYKAGRRVRLMDPGMLADEALVAVVSTQGAPIVGQERLANPEISARPLRLMEEFLGRKFDAVMPIEVGGGNGLLPLMIAALSGLPAVDADAMGRAYPEAQMTSFSVANLQCFPLAMADIRGNEILIKRAEDWTWMERISRKICTELGSTATTCKAPRTGAEVKAHGVLYTASKAIDLGKAILAARASHSDPVAAIAEECGGKQMFAGKITDIERRTTEGFLRGRARLAGLDGDRGHEFALDFQNEYTVGSRDGQPVVMSPDLICVVDSVTGDGVATESIRYGQRVSVLALPAPEIFRTPRGQELVGPRAFGFDFDYQSVFEG
ncbi:DUF917 domain-containing protein [Sneathiella chinensis]|uniref:DUF917 domain-containing protein n=1 Tax=Sneathiella chinensis TaxID=349750 RepID=A0ABQ5U3Y1_9PROT|nr:DUF917 domain-containing protein [Sneathiella chinensis]GLQ05905.1 hypothetical protein GCM10007924_11260 [Sneathiella chinensis]